MKQEERDNILEQNSDVEAWNYYKAVGAKLLQKGKITPEHYHNQVRAMGIASGGIDANNKDIPETIDDNEGLKLGLEIGGAVGGSLAWGGIRMAGPLGFAAYVTKQSLASGVGAGLGTFAYHKIMGSPEAATDEARADAINTGTDVAGFNAAFMAGLPIAGKVAKLGYQTAKLGLAGIGGVVKAVPGVKGSLNYVKEHSKKYMSEKNDFANQLQKTAAERGIVLSNAMIAGPTFRAILESFSTVPFIGTPLRASYEKSLKSVADTLVDDIASGATVEQAVSKFSNRFKFDKGTNKYVLNQLKGYNPDEINIESYVQLLNRAESYNTGYKKILDGMFGTFTKGQRILPGTTPTIITAAAAKGDIKFGTLRAWWKRIEDAGQASHYPHELAVTMNKIKQMKINGNYQMNGELLKRTFNDLNKIERSLLNKVEGSYADDLYRNFDDARGALKADILNGINNSSQRKLVNNEFKNLLSAKNEQRSFLDKAEQTGMLSATNIVFREGGKFVEKINVAMRENSLVNVPKGKTYSEGLRSAQNGNYFVLPGSTTEAAKRAAGKYKDAGYEEIMTKLYKEGGSAQHKNLIDLIGQKNYSKLAQNELDDIFDSTVIDYLNKGGGNGRELFLQKIGASGTAAEMSVAKKRIELILSNLNQARRGQTITVGGKTANLKDITWNNLRDYGEVLKFLPERPNLNRFVQRSLALKFAGGLSAASVTGFVGIGGSMAAGGPLAGLATGMAMRLFSSVMSKPYKYDGVVELLKKAPTNPEARKKFMDYMEQEASPLTKVINGNYLRELSKKDPNMLKAVRATGATTTAESMDGEQKLKEYGMFK